MLLIYPAIYLSLGRYAWRGLQGRRTITNFGIKAGLIARFYGILYLLILIGLTGIIPILVRYLMDMAPAELLRSFEFPFKDQGTGFVFLVLGLGFYPLIWYLRRYTQAKYPELAEKLKMRPRYQLYQYSIC